MKYLIVFILFPFGLTICFAQNREKGGVEYELKNGRSIIISKSTYDSLVNMPMPKDSVLARELQIKTINELYYSKRNSLFQNMIYKPVPEFKAKDTEGYAQSVSSYHGRVLVLHFWSFWSNSFHDEIPELNRLMDKYSKDGLAVLSFTSLPIKDEEKLKLKENSLKFPLIEDAHKFPDDFFQMKLMRPCIVIVDKNGMMRYFYDGQLIHKDRKNSEEKLIYDFEEHIKNLLK